MFLAIKRNEVLIHASTWMNLENIMLSERTQTQQVTYCMIAFVRIVWQIYKDIKYMSDCLARTGYRMMGQVLKGNGE